MKTLKDFIIESSKNTVKLTVEELIKWFFNVKDLKDVDITAFEYMWPESLDAKTLKQFNDAFEALKFLRENENENIEVEISDERYEHNHSFNLKGKYFNIVASEKYPDEIEWEYCSRCNVAVLPGELQNGYCDICYGDMHG